MLTFAKGLKDKRNLAFAIKAWRKARFSLMNSMLLLLLQNHQ
ncbi:hypothetical protein BBEV_1055 [Salisediminibacterium beveridgei]|uniref:Uncharacterized protein n=1 Tax=Salisediminibacterium beveridgei TaxID=632773 RepID=A0A1D7QTS6_9BACI|nr:hypothetical protein BBEV_1055 [Salisediminibacterium beveridgei]